MCAINLMNGEILHPKCGTAALSSELSKHERLATKHVKSGSKVDQCTNSDPAIDPLRFGVYREIAATFHPGAGWSILRS